MSSIIKKINIEPNKLKYVLEALTHTIIHKVFLFKNFDD